MLLTGASAWAQTTTLLEYGTTDVAWSTTNLAEWTAGGSPSLADGIVTISGGNGSYATSKTISPADKAIINVQAVWRGRSNTGRAFSAGNGSYFRFGNIIVAQNDQDKKHGYGFAGLTNIGSVTTFTAGSYRVDIANSTWLLIEMEINTGSNKVTSFSIKSEDGETTYASAKDIVLEKADYTTVAFGYQKTGSVSTSNAEQLKSVKITQTIKDTEYAKYTVKYVCGDTEVKDAAERSGEVDSEITLTSSDTENFYANDKKYIYVSNDGEGKTVASDGSVVVTVTFREAEKYAWTAKSSVGTYSISGETWEGDKASVKYPFYQLVEGKLWKKDATDKVFAQSFDITENNQELTLEYTETDIENVVFFTEMEDVEGMGIVNSGNAEARSSQRAAGYSANSKTKFASLPAGKYQIYARFYSPTSAGGSYKFYAGNREVWDQTTGNSNATDANAEILLAQDDNELLLGQGGYTAAVDFVYIVKTADLTDEEIAEIKAADVKADKAARVFSIVGENVTGGWDSDYAMTQSTKDGEEDIYTLTLNDFEAWPGTTYEYKLRQNNNWDGYQLPAKGEGNKSFTVNKGGVYKLIFTADVANNTLNVQTILTKSYIYTASYTNTYNWGAVYAYAWSGDGDSKVEQLGTWPGIQLSADANGLYTATIVNKIAPEYIIFNANDGNQTGDFVFVDGSIYNYNGDKSVTINVTAAGYATYCSALALDFTAVEGLTAYKATVTGSEVKFDKVEMVPAGEGVLVKAAEGKYIVPSVASADAIDNAFVGAVEPTEVAAGSFVLMNGGEGVGFYKTANAFVVGANTAYLPAISTARFISLDTEGEISTGIETLKKENNVLNNEYYNLSGQRVVKPTKGLYIVNGKKMVIK